MCSKKRFDLLHSFLIFSLFLFLNSKCLHIHTQMLWMSAFVKYFTFEISQSWRWSQKFLVINIPPWGLDKWGPTPRIRMWRTWGRRGRRTTARSASRWPRSRSPPAWRGTSRVTCHVSHDTRKLYYSPFSGEEKLLHQSLQGDNQIWRLVRGK